MEIRLPSGKLTAEAKQHIVNSHTSGEAILAIAERLAMNAEKVRKILRRYNVPIVKGDLIPESVKSEIIAAYVSGESSASIAERIKRSQNQVIYVCRLAGVVRQQRHLTDADKATIIAEYKAGKNGVQIGKLLGFTNATVIEYLNEIGLCRGVYRFTDTEEKQIIEAYKGGESSESIARRLNASGSCILKIIRRGGMEPRNAKKAAQLRDAIRARNFNYCYVRRRVLMGKIRSLATYQNWREAVLDRDERKCCLCSSKRKVQADHIYPFSAIIHNYKIESLEQAVQCELLWRVDNGRALCEDCHKKTDTHGIRARRYWQQSTQPLSDTYGDGTRWRPTNNTSHV